jgi:peroxiredoxin
LARPAELPIVAEVNGVAIYPEHLTRMARIDAVLAEWLDRAPPGTSDLLERAVNAELVTQAARKAGYTYPTEAVSATLAAFLVDRGRTQADLDAVLAANGIAPDVFRTYYGQLLMVDAFTRQAAQEAEQTVAEVLTALRRDADIVTYAYELPPIPTPVIPTLATAVAPSPTPIPPTATAAPSAVPSVMPSPTPSPVADATPERRGTAVGDLAPVFSLTTLDGETVSWESLLGRPVVLSFWVTWCGHCRTQTPRLIAAHERYAAQGVQFVGISVNESRDSVAPYVDQQSIPYPIVLDSDGAVGARYGVRGFPTTYFLDHEGRVAAVHVGELQAVDIDRCLAQLLAGSEE